MLDGDVDAGQRIVDTIEDAIQTPCETQTVVEKAHVDPVEEVISTKVIEHDMPVDSDEHEEKGLIWKRLQMREMYLVVFSVIILVNWKLMRL